MLERFSYSDTWINFILIGVFVGIVALKQINAHRFRLLINLGWTNDYIKHVLHSSKKDLYFSSLLVFIASFCYGLVFIMHNHYPSNEIKLELLLRPFIFISAYLFIKYSTQKLVGYIFQMDKEIHQYLSFKYNLLYYVGLMMYIPLLLLVYSHLKIHYLNMVLVSLLFFYCLRIVIFYFKSRSLITNHLFYFILYICSFEIIPVFFLIKVFK